MMHRGQDDRGFFPPVERAQIENLACSDPAESGLEQIRWSVRALADAAVEQEIVDRIHYTSVALLLRQATLKPHRSRYWKSTVWNAQAVECASKVLWCYEQVEWLLARGEIVMCLDESPNLQALEHAPRKLMRPGQIEHQEFEYLRHGTVNLLAGITLHNGRMWAECLERNDSPHFQAALGRCLTEQIQYLKKHEGIEVKKVHLIVDNGPSHASNDTLRFFKQLQPNLRVLFTPPHASWLDQAELLLRAFGERYLRRGNWSSCKAMITHLLASVREYNLRHAKPFHWTWTRNDFRAWVKPRLI